MYIEKEHIVKVYGSHLSYYKTLGFQVSCGCTIIVKTSQLPKTSQQEIEAKCEGCGQVVKTTYITYTRCKKGFVCSGKCRMKLTNMHLFEETGCTNFSQLNSVKIKKERKAVKKYGVKNVSQSQEIKEKKKKSCFKNHGVDNPSKSKSIQKKKSETMMKNYGVEHPFESPVIRKRILKTIRKKYADNTITNVSQVSEVMDKKIKTSIRTRNYTLPSGTTIRIQGYEHFGIDYLLSNGYSECDIIFGNKNIENQIGKIYFHVNNKKKRYFPDIFIPSENKIIEVKSIYTSTLNPHLIYVKQETVIKYGYEYEMLVFNSKGILTNNR